MDSSWGVGDVWDEPIAWEWYLKLHPHHGECRTPANPGQSLMLPALVLALARNRLGEPGEN